MAASPAEDRERSADESEARAERRATPEQPTIEDVQRMIEEAVHLAEEKRNSIEDAQRMIAARVVQYRSELTSTERAKLGAIAAAASEQLRALQAKGEETVARVTALPEGAVRPGEVVGEADEVLAVGHPRAETAPAPSVDAAEELMHAATERMRIGEQLPDDAVQEVIAYVRTLKSLPSKADKARLGAAIQVFTNEVRKTRREGSPVTEEQIISETPIPEGPSQAKREADAVLSEWGEKPPEVTLTVGPEIAALQRHIERLRMRRTARARVFANPTESQLRILDEIDDEITEAEREIVERSGAKPSAASDVAEATLPGREVPPPNLPIVPGATMPGMGTLPGTGGEPTLRGTPDSTRTGATMRGPDGAPTLVGRGGEPTAIETGTMSGRGGEPTIIGRAPDATIMAATEPGLARAVEARRLLNIAKLRDRYQGDPAQLDAAIRQVQYAEHRAVLANAEIRAQLETALRSLTDFEANAAARDAALTRVASEVGLPPAELQWVMHRRDDALRERARQDVLAESSAGGVRRWFGFAGKTGAYAGAGIGAALLHVPGASFLLSGARIAENWFRGRSHERKVAARLAELRGELGTGASSPALEEFLRDTAAEIAIQKQAQVDGRSTELDPARGDAYRAEVLAYLEQTQPRLSPEQRELMANAAGAMFEIDRRSEAMTLELARERPGFLDRAINFFGGSVLGHERLRGGESGRERALTAAVMGAAGALAREIPGIRNILLGYTGMKAAEAVAMGYTRRSGRFASLNNPVTSEQLSAMLGSDRVDPMVLHRARAQVMDPEYRRQHLAEVGRLREVLDRHEEVLLTRADRLMEHVAERSAGIEATMTERIRLKKQRERVVNSARVAGFAIGALLGPLAVEWVAGRIQPKSAAAAPVAERAPVAAAEAAPLDVAPRAPDFDPKFLDLAQVRPGDGYTDIMARQLLARGAEGHPPMSPDDILKLKQGEFPSWAVRGAKELAIRDGFLGADGRLTVAGLRALEAGKEGGFLLKADDTVQPIGTPEQYAANAPLGFPETPAAAGATGPVEEAVGPPAPERPLPPVEPAWLRAHPDAQVVEVAAPVEAPAAAEETEVTFAGGEVEALVSTSRAEGFSGAFLDIFRGEHSVADRMHQLTEYLQRTTRFSDGNHDFQLGADGLPEWRTTGTGVFFKMSAADMEEFIRNQREEDEQFGQR